MQIIDFTLASVIAVLQLTSLTISLCYDYRSRVKNAPKSLSRITDQLTSLRNVLESLVKHAESEAANGSPPFPTLKLLGERDGPLVKCKAELVSLKAMLEPASGWKAVGQALAWPLKEGDITKTLDNLERTKATLQLALTADQT